MYLELDLDGYLESSNNNNNKPQNQKRIDPNLLACTFVDDTLAKSFLRQIANDSNADDLNHHLRALTSDKSFFSQLCASRKQYQLNALRWYVALNSIGDYLNTNGSLNTQTLFNHCLLNHKSDSNPFSYFVNVAKAQPITPVNKQAKSKKPTASDAFAPVPDYVVDHDELARIARDSDTRKGAN